MFRIMTMIMKMKNGLVVPLRYSLAQPIVYASVKVAEKGRIQENTLV